MAFKYNIVLAFEEERAEGKAEGMAECILNLLEELGIVAEGLKEKVYEQKDMEVLRRWFKLAACSETVGEFERKIAGISRTEEPAYSTV